MLKLKLMMFLVDEKQDEYGIHSTIIYDRQAASYFLPNQFICPEQCIIEALDNTFNNLREGVALTLRKESKFDIDKVYDSNKKTCMWEDMIDKEGTNENR